MENQPARIFCVWVIFLGATTCFADETPTGTAAPKTAMPAVKTDFAPGDQLNPQEIKQVLALAKQYGITNAGRISTIYSLPGGRKEGVSVQSTERVDGRNVRYETLHINKDGWSYFTRPTSAKHIGNFWIDADQKSWPTLLRSYRWTDQQPFQVSIGEGVAISIADKLVSLLSADKLPFSEKKKTSETESPNFTSSFFEKPTDLKPESIYRDESKNSFKVEFRGQFVFQYQFINGEFVYSGSYRYNI
ncbi:MAG TPA: hypothetical protein VG347_11560 [Verrucomicrobiae bacterium]|nr:hypothetical protein [Verrucomicrobiae bacterium]